MEEGKKLVAPVSMGPGKREEFLGLGDNRTLLKCSGNDDGPSSTHFEQALISKQPKRAQHGIGVDSEDRREVLGLGYPVSRTRFSVRDRPSNLGRHLIVEQCLVATIHLAQL